MFIFAFFIFLSQRLLDVVDEYNKGNIDSAYEKVLEILSIGGEEEKIARGIKKELEWSRGVEEKEAVLISKFFTPEILKNEEKVYFGIWRAKKLYLLQNLDKEIIDIISPEIIFSLFPVGEEVKRNYKVMEFLKGLDFYFDIIYDFSKELHCNDSLSLIPKNRKIKLTKKEIVYEGIDISRELKGFAQPLCVFLFDNAKNSAHIIPQFYFKRITDVYFLGGPNIRGIEKYIEPRYVKDNIFYVDYVRVEDTTLEDFFSVAKIFARMKGGEERINTINGEILITPSYIMQTYYIFKITKDGKEIIKALKPE